MQEKAPSFSGHKSKAIIHEAKGTPIVFLHGYSYDRTIWQKLGITELLTAKHVPFMALDMPYGAKNECYPKIHDPGINVEITHEATEKTFNRRAPIIVGASLGGYIALRYAAKYPVKGLLLIAPARAFEEDSLTSTYPKFNFPTRIIWGSEDNIISGEEMRTLSDRLPNSKLFTYEGAGHSAYKEQPERFKRDLLELYATAELT